jgi:regulatory protein
MDFAEALIKARFYCAQQERSRFEIKRKLAQWGLDPHDFEAVIAALEKEDFFSEVRFAELFALSKMNQKRWGRIKIREELIKHQLGHAVIEDALAKLDETKIRSNLAHLAYKKQEELKRRNAEHTNEKLKRFLYSKGYEAELIIDFLSNE